MITFSVDYAAIGRWFPVMLILFLRFFSTNILVMLASTLVGVLVGIYVLFFGSHDVILVVAAMNFLVLLTFIQSLFTPLIPGASRLIIFLMAAVSFIFTTALFHKAGMF